MLWDISGGDDDHREAADSWWTHLKGSLQWMGLIAGVALTFAIIVFVAGGIWMLLSRTAPPG